MLIISTFIYLHFYTSPLMIGSITVHEIGPSGILCNTCVLIVTSLINCIYIHIVCIQAHIHRIYPRGAGLLGREAIWELKREKMMSARTPDDILPSLLDFRKLPFLPIPFIYFPNLYQLCSEPRGGNL